MIPQITVRNWPNIEIALLVVTSIVLFGLVIYVDYLLGIMRDKRPENQLSCIQAKASLRKTFVWVLIGFPLVCGYLIFSLQ